MSAAAPALYRIYDLPWTTGEVERERLRRIMRVTFGALLVLSLVMSFLPVPQQNADEPQEIPKRLARLVVERQAPPPPPPPPVVREEPVEPPPVVEPERVVEERPEPTPVVENEPPPPPVDTTAQARDRARSAGVLQFSSQLSALRTSADVTANRLERTGTVGAGTEAVAVNERSLITSRVGTASGGINTASLSRNTGGGGLGDRATTVVESPVEGFGEAGGAAQRSGESDRGSRSREEIERVFDANKGRIFTLYNRALRENPALQGKVVLRLTIAADGRVTHCEIVSSELNDPELERSLVQRVLLFQFEARDDIEPITTTKPIDFFPA